MRLHEFISANMEPILKEWEQFARENQPAGSDMGVPELRDHARSMLQVIVADMNSAQTERERADKSQGHSPAADAETPAEVHATERLESGFSIGLLTAEYRALRASVLRLWCRDAWSREEQALEDVIRFNEAIDQALAESVSRYCDELIKNSDFFIGMLGHDLRSPLQFINLAAYKLGELKDADGSLGELGRRMLDSVERMKGMLDDLMDFTESRVGGGIRISCKDMDMAELCGNVVAALSATNPDRVIRLKTNGDCTGNWDAGRVAQICQNLIVNALQHGGADGEIEVTCDASVDEVMIAVHNDGEPIPDAQLQKIFELSERGVQPTNSAHRNLGLGLYIVKELARVHNGSASVTSSESGGTLFQVVLPKQVF